MTKGELIKIIEAIPPEKRRWRKGTRSYDDGIFLDADGAFTGACLGKFYDRSIQDYLLGVSPENLLTLLKG